MTGQLSNGDRTVLDESREWGTYLLQKSASPRTFRMLSFVDSDCVGMILHRSINIKFWTGEIPFLMILIHL